MFLPEGFSYEARFKQRHLDPKFLEKVNSEDDRKKLSGQTALICLRTKLPKENHDGTLPFRDTSSFFEHSVSGSKKMVTPLRIVEVQDVRLVAGIVLLRYRVAQFYNFGAGDNLSNARIKRQEFNEQIYSCCNLIDNSENEEENNEIHHVFESDHLAISATAPKEISLNSEEMRDIDGSISLNWRIVVALLHFQPFLQALPYVLYCGLRRQNPPSRIVRFEKWFAKSRLGRVLLGSKSSSEENDFSKLNFDTNTTYELKVFETYPQEMVRRLEGKSKLPQEYFRHSREYSLELDDNFFSEKRSQQAIGGYDFLEFAIQVRPGRAGSMGSLHLDISEFLGDKKKFISKQVDLEYQVATGLTSFWGLLGGVLLLIMAIISTSRWTDTLVEYPTLKFLAELTIDVVYAAGIVGVVQYWVSKR
jgi:hypothetical protein